MLIVSQYWGRSAAYHASSTVCLRNLAKFGSQSTGICRTVKHWRSVPEYYTSAFLQSASLPTRPVDSRPASSTNMHTRMRAVRRPEAVRLHASSLPIQNKHCPFPPLVEGLKEATSMDTSNHDTCIRPYDRTHAATPFPSIVCLFLLTSCRGFH